MGSEVQSRLQLRQDSFLKKLFDRSGPRRQAMATIMSAVLHHGASPGNPLWSEGIVVVNPAAPVKAVTNHALGEHK